MENTDEDDKANKDLPSISPVARFKKSEIDDLEQAEKKLLENLKLQVAKFKEVVSTRDDTTSQFAESDDMLRMTWRSNQIMIQEEGCELESQDSFRQFVTPLKNDETFSRALTEKQVRISVTAPSEMARSRQ